MKRRSVGEVRAVAEADVPLYELECLPGLEEFVADEVAERLGSRAAPAGRPRPGRLQVRLRGDAARLAGLRSIVAAHLLLRFDVPRPKALLGHQHFTRLVAAARDLLQRAPEGFTTLRLSAAGADSVVMQRFQAELAQSLGLQAGDEQADLLVSMRRPPDGSAGWEVLLRTTPRPLSARAWRVCNLPGALNATTAHAMVRLVADRPGKSVVNLVCGSGTLLVEYLDRAPAKAAVGIDVSGEALACAVHNVAAAGRGGEVLLLRGDATCLPLPDRCADVLLADLPFGMLMGSATDNERLYPALLREAARVARPSARLVAITASTRAFDVAAATVAGTWRPRRSYPISVPYKSGYVTPTIYVMERV